MIKRILHAFILSVAFSIISWKVIDQFIMPIEFDKFYLIELVVLIMGKLYSKVFSKVMDQEPRHDNVKDTKREYTE